MDCNVRNTTQFETRNIINHKPIAALMADSTLKQRAFKGMLWSFSENSLRQLIQFIVGVVLARILSPREFGLVGMLTFFIALSTVFIEGGFGQALIRKEEASRSDCSTVFYFNLGVAFICYSLLFTGANLIASFFNEPALAGLLRVLGLVLFFNSLGLIQTTILTREVDFKTQAKVTLVASVISGVISIFAAVMGMGVWSLVIKTLLFSAVQATMLWFLNPWRPSLEFDVHAFKEMGAFGSKLLASSTLSVAYLNIFYLVIGKFFSAAELGFYTRADQFKKLVSQNVSTTVQRVSYPVLSTLQSDIPRLKQGYKKAIKSTTFITLPLLAGMAAVAEPLIVVLIGEKWLPSVPLLQLLCLVGAFHPLHALNLNVLKVLGRSDLYLKLEIIKKLLVIPVIAIGIQWGITGLIIALLVQTSIAYLINSYYTKILIGYAVSEQIIDILPAVASALSMSGIVALLGRLMEAQMPVELAVLVTTGALFYYLIARLFKMDSLTEITSGLLMLFNNRNVTST